MALTNLAETYRALRKYRLAESMQRKALGLAENTFGQENEYTLIAISKLAVTLNAMNKVREAEKLQKHILELMRKSASPERPDMLGAYGDLAQTLSKQGKQAEAVQIQREIVRVQKRVEVSHPSTLNSMNNLAAMLGDQRNFKEAEEVYLETFEAEKKILGNQHPYTLITMINLADIYRNLEKYGESERMQRDALELSQEVLGPDHPATLSSLQNLLLLLRQQGMDEEARQVESKHKAFGSADAYTIIIACSLSSELNAISKMLDNEHEMFSLPLGHGNHYILGRIGHFNVAVAMPAMGDYGKLGMANVVGSATLIFKNIRLCISVGIGGGVPGRLHDVRIGNVVVGAPVAVELDLGRRPGFESKEVIRFPQRLMHVVDELDNQLKTVGPHGFLERTFFSEHLSRPGVDNLVGADHGGFNAEDGSFQANTIELTLQPVGADLSLETTRSPRKANEIKVHRSTIVVIKNLVKSATIRDRISNDYNNALCIAMNPADSINDLPTILIRGISDYADSQRSKVWQNNAATTAAAYARQVLLCLPEDEMEELSPHQEGFNYSKTINMNNSGVQIGINQGSINIHNYSFTI